MPNDDNLAPRASQRTDWGVAIAIALSIFICLAAFIWIFVEIEPFMSDFTGSDAIITPDPSTPPATPVDGTDRSD